MNPRVGNTGASSPADIEAVEALLGELEIGDAETLNAIEEIVEPENDAEDEGVPEELTAAADPVPEVLNADDAAALDADLARAESYEETPASSVTTDAPAAAALEKPVASTKAARATKPAATPRVGVNNLKPEAFVLTTDVPADLETNKTAVLATRPTQKKIADKFDNLLVSIAGNRRPSTYTMDCFEILAAKRSVTSGDLVKGLMAMNRRDGTKTYSEGTARSQAGQIMVLFDVLKIAKREKQGLAINDESTLVLALTDLLTAPAAGVAATS